MLIEYTAQISASTQLNCFVCIVKRKTTFKTHKLRLKCVWVTCTHRRRSRAPFHFQFWCQSTLSGRSLLQRSNMWGTPPTRPVTTRCPMNPFYIFALCLDGFFKYIHDWCTIAQTQHLLWDVAHLLLRLLHRDIHRIKSFSSLRGGKYSFHRMASWRNILLGELKLILWFSAKRTNLTVAVAPA